MPPASLKQPFPSTSHSALRYVLYARKSSESEDRQVQSIEDQTRIMREAAQARGLAVIEQITESHSAKDPGKRPGFEKMVSLIEKGRVDAILCWHVNRLTRNPIDAGRLSWLLQSEKLQAIQTNDRVFLPSDNVLLFAIETGVATQDILTMKKNVRRGTESKLAKGWAPYRAPEGYRNNVYDHTIEPDPERFELVRRAWRLLIAGTHTVAQVWRIMNEEWGYRTRRTHKGGNKPLARTIAYKMFTNSFYAGYFRYDGQVFQGSHTPMISLAEFEQAQIHIRGQVGKPHRHKHEFAYVGMMNCGKCGNTITAEVQKGRHGRRSYVYYHCSNLHGSCGKKSIREEALEDRIAGCLSRITIPTEFRKIAMQALEDWIDSEVGGLATVQKGQSQTLTQAERMLSELLELRLQGIIDNETYLAKQQEFKATISSLRVSAAQNHARVERTLESVRNVLQFRETAEAQYAAGNAVIRRAIAMALGYRYLLTDNEVSIETNPLLTVMQDRSDQDRFVKTASRFRNKSVVASAPVPGGNGSKWALRRHIIEPQKSGSQRPKETSDKSKVSFGWTPRTDTEQMLGELHGFFSSVMDSGGYFPRPSWLPVEF